MILPRETPHWPAALDYFLIHHVDGDGVMSHSGLTEPDLSTTDWWRASDGKWYPPLDGKTYGLASFQLPNSSDSVPSGDKALVAGVSVAGVLFLIGGVALIVFGIFFRGHYNTLSQQCGTGIGKVAQEVSGHVELQCGDWATRSDLGVAAIFFGIAGLGWGVKISRTGLLAMLSLRARAIRRRPFAPTSLPTSPV
jgi:hypothetical protein